jgi:MFS family permease
MFAFWGWGVWIPAYLTLPVQEGGIGLSAYTMSIMYVAMQVGKWLGYVTFGFISDKFGRKRTYVIYLVTAALFVVAYIAVRNPWALLVLGPFATLFGTGYFAGFGAVTAEIYPTEIRATAQGFTYNIGRVASAVAPFVVGSLAETHGFAVALGMSAIAFLVAALMWIWIPETKGKVLE